VVSAKFKKGDVVIVTHTGHPREGEVLIIDQNNNQSEYKKLVDNYHNIFGLMPGEEEMK